MSRTQPPRGRRQLGGVQCFYETGTTIVIPPRKDRIAIEARGGDQVGDLYGISKCRYSYRQTDMSNGISLIELEKTRRRVAARVRALRKARGWTQAELAGRLGLSQNRLSEIERGKGSFSAEQFIVVLALFNASIAEFVPPADTEDELQNVLIQLGATHLREVPGVVSTGRFEAPVDAVIAVLLQPWSTRLVTALAPVLLKQVDAISLPLLRARLDASSRSARLGWLLENVRDALLVPPASPNAAWRRRAARAITVATSELARFAPPPNPAASPPDLFDTTIRSAKSLEEVWSNASKVSRRWGVATEIRTEDFQQAIWQAHGSD
jgi:transcriptional regulator with XRE-family HTH domain